MSKTIKDNYGLFGENVLRIDDDGTIREPYINGTILGKIDQEGTIYKITEYGMLPVGHLSEDGEIYKHTLFGNDYQGSIKNDSLRDRYGYGTDNIGLLRDKKEESKPRNLSVNPAQAPSSEGSALGVGVIAVFIACALVYFFRATIPLHIHNMFLIGETEFFFLTMPVLLILALFLISLFKGSFNGAYGGASGIFASVIALTLAAVMVYVVTDFIVMAILCIIDKASFGEWLVASISMPIMYAPTFIVILVPSVIIGAIVINLFSKKV